MPTEVTTTSHDALPAGPLSGDELAALDAWWRAANYLSVGQIYLMGNPLLREPLRPEHVKPRLLGHWGTTPGLNFVYAHLNRVIAARDLDMIYVMGPGHGGPGPVAAAWLEGTYSEVYPDVSQDAAGMRPAVHPVLLPRRHPEPRRAGDARVDPRGRRARATRSSHAYGAAFDNPDLVVASVVGDGEAETGPLAASWHSNKFVDPVSDGAVLPILHLNGYKIANPTVLARIPREELLELLRGYGHTPYLVEGDDPATMHQQFAATLDRCLDEIAEIQRRAREDGVTEPAALADDRAALAEGLDRPEDGRRPAGRGHLARRTRCRSTNAREDDGHRAVLEDWLRSYRPEELFDDDGAPVPAVRDLHPAGRRRMSANPHANGGELLPTAAHAGLPRLRRRRCRRRAPERSRRPGCWARSCAR